MRLALIVSFLLAGGACLLFFFSFERRKPSVKDILPVVVMVAVASAGRVVFNFLPQIQPVTAIVIIMGVYCGKQTGFLTGSLCALVSNLFLGQGPWTGGSAGRGFGKGAVFPPSLGCLRLRLSGGFPLRSRHRFVDDYGHGRKPELAFSFHRLCRGGSL